MGEVINESVLAGAI